MTPDDFRAWRAGLNLTQKQAAERLGISTSQLTNYEAGVNRGSGRRAPIPRTVALACAAVAAGLEPWAPGEREDETIAE